MTERRKLQLINMADRNTIDTLDMHNRDLPSMKNRSEMELYYNRMADNFRAYISYVEEQEGSD